MKERNFSNINEFCEEAQANSITTVILCYTDEWGPSPRENHAVYCGPRTEMCLLAYIDGSIWRCFLQGEEAKREAVQAVVSSYGLQWEERSRNNAKYNS